MPTSARHLIFHAAVVLLFGLLLGAPYARAIKRGAAAHVVNSWRVAHLSLPIGATLMLATAPVLLAMISSRVACKLSTPSTSTVAYVLEKGPLHSQGQIKDDGLCGSAAMRLSLTTC